MFGSHLSISGGLWKAADAAKGYGMETVQVFTKNQQQWNTKPLSEDEIQLWKKHIAGLHKPVSHDSYLINLASPDVAENGVYRKSLNLFAEEIRRCELLGIEYLVTHPGSHLGQGEEVGLKRVAEGLDAAYEMSGGKKTIVCLEITAGQGTSLGFKLEHLAKIIELSKVSDKLGVCLDTAHLFAAGYDFRGSKYAGFIKDVDKIIGKKRVKVLHLNDSKKDLGSHVDRHDHVGLGKIGDEGFVGWVNDPDFVNIPKILETPKEGLTADGKEWDVANLEKLKSLIR
jgi:deoxyribonuclease-4